MTGLHGAPVVVGVDGSPDARVAAHYAAGEAARRHLPLRLGQGLRPPGPVPFGAGPAAAPTPPAGGAARRPLPLRLVHGLRPPAAYSFGAVIAVDLSAVVRDLR